MDITNINLGACPLQYLSIGYVGEAGARPVAFDFSDWATEYGSGVLQLLLQRPGDANPYPVLLDIDGTTATWTPDATATEKSGQGQAQLVYTVGGVVVKNAIFRVLIAPSLGAAGDPPEPYEDWLERLTELAAETQQNALDAAESAEAAEASAGAAAVSAGAAAQSALDAESAQADAEAAEIDAGQSAAIAREKAAEAAQAAQTAAQEADYAQQQRVMAEAAAADAHDSAESAEAAEAGANQAKTDAERAADAAAVSATAAGDAATQAEQSAQAAEQEADAARQSAQDAQASETAAGNAADAAGTSRDAAAQSAALAALAKTDAETAATDAAASAASAAASAAVAQELIDQIPDIEAEIDGKAPVIYASAGPAAVVTVTDGAEDMPIKTLTVDIPPTQSGTGDPSPENVRPISGWTGANVVRTGANLWDEAWEVGGISTSTGGNIAQTDRIRSKNYIPLKPGTAFNLHNGSRNNINAFYYDSNKTFVSSVSYGTAANLTIIPNYPFMRIIVSATTQYGNNISINYPATDYNYHNGAENIVLPISWETEAGTVYGGTLTVNQDGSGTLSVLPHYASYNGETLVGPWVSSMDVYAEGAVPTTGAEVVDLGGAATVYQLTAEQIKALAGVNNIWSNAGDVTVEYPADTKSYIDEQTAGLSGRIDALEAAQPKTVTVTGTVVTITAEDNVRYVCGELATLTLTPPASGICDVVFTSGTTPTVLTVPSTVRWPSWFDPTALEASTTYEINVQDGLAVVATWAV